MRASSGQDAARIWDRFAPSKGSKGQAPPTTRTPQQQGGRQMPPAHLIRGNR